MEDTFETSYTNLPWDKRGPASRFMKDFEGHKRDFGTPDDLSEIFVLNLVMKDAEDSDNYDTDDHTVRITA